MTVIDVLLLENGDRSLLEFGDFSLLELDATFLDASPTLFAPAVIGGDVTPIVSVRYREQRHPIWREMTMPRDAEQRHPIYVEEP